MSKIRVRAPEGRTCPIHPADHTESGDVFLLAPGQELDVENSPGVRRRIRSGDLEVVKPEKPKTEAAPARPDVSPELPPSAAKSGR